MDLNSAITLEGSSHLVVKFFECGLTHILYQRGIYPSDDFDVTTKYGMNTVVTNNPELRQYIDKIIKQIEIWLKSNSISKLVIVIRSVETDEVLERWHFDIELNNGENGIPMPENIPPEQAVEIQKEAIRQIRGILRQITSSVSYLPEFKEECTFNVLVYGDKDIEAPVAWSDSDASLIKGGGEHVKYKPFSTLVHKVEPFVAYKPDDDYM
ncbi:mitotic spindle checkpoint component mad2 [Rhizopus microsporus ATCC 52813]|uniref:Mitotic spindle checkpoint component mad2 n=1 Tax=Rhizopus microsporus ATCC 52813 TaxID=1340429 RepID=A0A2G4SRI0_RHIZD|nr:mitotic spindle checkpoint component mad2 [Rhizopus microsporus ATCC 52813]PHZ11352.1 mitotic spindle checkpoint component mad2 [Rhizopus microsporus ATCC 52813]